MGEVSERSQIQPVRSPSNSATCASVNRSASPRSTERFNSRAMALRTESSWLSRRRFAPFSPPSGESEILPSFSRSKGVYLPASSLQRRSNLVGAIDCR